MRFPGQGFALWDMAVFDPLTAAISGGVSLLGSALSSGAASSAAAGQTDAANRAAANSQAQYQQTRADLAPYMQYGTTAGNKLMDRLPGFTTNFNPTMADLAATPGYQFTLDQGLKGVQNAASAHGLGASGAAQKGAADYAAGLASKTYQDQFNNYQTQNENNFNRLMKITGLGQNSAAGVGMQGIYATKAANDFATSGANAAAAGTIGSSNAIAGGLNNSANTLGNYMMLQKYGPSSPSQGNSA